MQTISVEADNFLRADGNVLGNDLVEQILDDLTIENEEKLRKQERNTPDAEDMPDEFILADLDGDELVMSRGYALRLKKLCRDHDRRVRWDDKRKWKRGKPFGKEEFSYRVHQPAAVEAIKRHEQGIYVAPTGSGKTVTIWGAVWELMPERALILVNRIELVDQWIKRFLQHTGGRIGDIGRIGEGVWDDDKRFVVATVQSLWSKREELIESGWFDQWDFVCLDECHHVTADTFNAIMNEFCARYRIGVSATPSKTGHFKLASTVLGEIFYEDDYDELVRLGVLMRPHVEVVETDFEVPFWGFHNTTKFGQSCEKPGCKKKEPHGHRSNYNDVVSMLVRDQERNYQIWDKIAEHRGEVQIVVTDRTTHIDAMIGDKPLEHDPIFIITGKQTGKERGRLIKQVESGKPAIVFTTVGGEGLDIPVINRVHMPWPMKNPEKARQILGRGLRVTESKTETVILDYADTLMGVFKGHLKRRIQGCYLPMGFEIIGYDRPARATGGSGLGRLGRI